MTPNKLPPANSATDSPTNDGAERIDFSRTVLRRTLRAVRRLLATAASDWKRDPEHVHRLRVAARKAQVALWLFSELTPSKHDDWFRRQLKSILTAAGQARDLDVLLQDQLRRCGTAQGQLRRRWQANRLVQQQPIAALANKMKNKQRFRRHLRKLIRGLSVPTKKKQQAIDESSVDPQSTGTANWARRRLTDAGKLFFDAIPAHADFESLHLLRRRAKRFRYAIELIRPLMQAPALKPLKSALAELQEQLGTLQDHVVAHCQFQLSVAEVTKPRLQQQQLR